jgi:hypothetical protein
VSIVDLASLGHSPTMTLNTYGHVIAELREAPRVSAAQQIQLARERFRGNAPIRTPEPTNAPSQEAEDRAALAKPTPGLEPGTPSLRVFTPASSQSRKRSVPGGSSAVRRGAVPGRRGCGR